MQSEYLFCDLHNCSAIVDERLWCLNCIQSHLKPNAYTVTADATIGFVGPPALTDHNTCQVEVRVVEGVGSVALNLTRTGNLQESVGVICYTKSGTASRGQDFHPRPNNAPSRIEFQPNETTAQCRIEIVDDTLHEITERFLVFLGTVQGRASVNSSTSPLCVYLHVDSNDSK